MLLWHVCATDPTRASAIRCNRPFCARSGGRLVRSLLQRGSTVRRLSRCQRLHKLVIHMDFKDQSARSHEAIGPLNALGIAMISGGIIAIALEGRHVSRAGALAA